MDCYAPTGWNWFLQGNDGFRKSAGMVEVRGAEIAQPLQLTLRLGEAVAIDWIIVGADVVPFQRRRNLERYILLRDFRIVAQDQPAVGDSKHVRVAVHLHV